MKFYILLLISLSIGQGCTSPDRVPDSANFVLTKTLSETKELAEAEFKVVESEITLTGKVTFDENKVARVFPLVGGFVKELNAEIGDYVRKGQVLAIVRSPEVAGFIQDGQEAQSRFQIAQKNVDVTEELYRGGHASEVQLISERNELARARSEVRRTNEVLELYGAGEGSTYSIKSPSTGYIIQKNIALNMEIRTEDISPVFIVGSLDEVWVMANVYESDISRIKEGYEVDIVTISYPDQVYKGKIDKIFNIMDPESRVLKARITLKNEKIELKPEMFAKVTVHFRTGESRVTVPSAAIVFDKSRYFVMIYHADDNIETREVTIFKQHGDVTYIEKGLKRGEIVMTRYQLLVYDALND